MQLCIVGGFWEHSRDTQLGSFLYPPTPPPPPSTAALVISVVHKHLCASLVLAVSRRRIGPNSLQCCGSKPWLRRNLCATSVRRIGDRGDSASSAAQLESVVTVEFQVAHIRLIRSVSGSRVAMVDICCVLYSLRQQE